MLFSINDSIIAISKYYKFNMALILILGIAMIGADMLLIPEFGLLGAAYAYFAVFTVYNILKMLLLKITSNLFPFTKKNHFCNGSNGHSLYAEFLFSFFYQSMVGYSHAIFNIGIDIYLFHLQTQIIR